MRLAVQQLLGGAAVEEQRPRVCDPAGEKLSILVGEIRREVRIGKPLWIFANRSVKCGALTSTSRRAP
jgi:hypothetical protein